MAWSNKFQSYNGGFRSMGRENTRQSYSPNPKKKSGCKFISFKNAKGQTGEMITGWNASRRGFLTFKAYKMTDAGCKAIASKRNYKEKYTSVTSNGNERWMYKAEFKGKDSPAKEYFSGIAIFKRSGKKLYFSRFGMVASCNAPNGGYFGKVSK